MKVVVVHAEGLAELPVARVLAQLADVDPPRRLVAVDLGDRVEDGELEEDEGLQRPLDELDEGLGPKDAAARLVVRTGKPRRHLYQLALSLQRGKRGEP